MSSVGVMASAVSLPSGVDVLLEKFNDFTTAPWVTTGSCNIVTGRTGTGGQIVGTASNNARYQFPSVNESAYVTVGFAYRVSNLTGTRAICELDSDTGATAHVYLDVTSTGVIEVRLGGSSGTILASSAAGKIAVNTYAYVEIAAFLHDTAGFVTVNVNGTLAVSATNVDTKAAGTKAVFDDLKLIGPTSGVNNIYDDLYITVGAGAVFKGSITIP